MLANQVRSLAYFPRLRGWTDDHITAIMQSYFPRHAWVNGFLANKRGNIPSISHALRVNDAVGFSWPGCRSLSHASWVDDSVNEVYLRF